MKSNPQKNKGRWKKVLLILLVVLLSLILVAGVGVTILLEYQLSRIRRPEDQITLSPEEISSVLQEEIQETDPELQLPTLAPEELTKPPETAPVIEKKDEVINILLVGQDTRGSHRAHSDAMVLCTINKDKKTLVMTSFLRDMYMHIPGFGPQRINVAYMVGGFPMLNATMLENFGVQADYNIEVDFNAFKQVIDLVGGVSIKLTAAEANWIAPGVLYPGVNHLDGKYALSYARIRKLDSDFGRTNRQRTVLLALLEQIRHVDVETLYNLVDTLIPYVTTDMTSAQILSLTLELAPLLPDLQVTSQRIPADDMYRSAWVDGMAVLIPDFEANRQVLKDTIGN